MADYINLSNLDIVQEYFKIAVWAQNNQQESLYKTALGTIEALMKSDLGKILISNLRDIPSIDSDTDAIKKWEKEIKEHRIMFTDKTNNK